MTQKRAGFFFFRAFRDAISELKTKEKIIIYEAIFAYALDGEESDLSEVSNTAKAMWSLIKPMLDSDLRRYENGCKGGAPKGNTNAQKSTETKQPKNNLKTTEKQPTNNKKQEQEQEQEQESVCEKSAHAHTQEDLILANFEKWCSQYAPTLLQFAEPMTAVQLDELRKKNSDAKIKECAAQVHNKSAYATNRSAFLTMRKWMANMRAN